MSHGLLQAPLDRILPSFSPVHLERGIPGYEEDALIPGETRLPRESVVALLIASGFIGAHVYALECGMEPQRVADALKASVPSIPGVSKEEAALVLNLVDRFQGFHILREDHALDDWVCEALWPAFQTAPYIYPSAMSGAVRFGLTIIHSLRKCELQF